MIGIEYKTDNKDTIFNFIKWILNAEISRCIYIFPSAQIYSTKKKPFRLRNGFSYYLKSEDYASGATSSAAAGASSTGAASALAFLAALAAVLAAASTICSFKSTND